MRLHKRPRLPDEKTVAEGAEDRPELHPFKVPEAEERKGHDHGHQAADDIVHRLNSVGGPIQLPRHLL